MSNRRVVPTVVASAVAIVFFGLGSFLAARPGDDTEQQIAVLRAEIEQLRKAQPNVATGTSGRAVATDLMRVDGHGRAAIVEDVKRQLQSEMGLLPLNLIRDRRQSFVELYSYDDRGSSSYGTAGYLGNGYFITVKHGVIALGQEGVADPRHITSIKLMYEGRAINARVVDSGDARVEVDPGDWAILKVREEVDLPPLQIDLDFAYEFADPIFRLGNDYSKGIILATGYVGQRTANQLVTCLTDGHPGVSGGGVLDRRGNLVGVPVGRMQGDYRFSFILPLRDEMFRKVPHLQRVPSLTE
jgi:S1-C subfamily serine protease